MADEGPAGALNGESCHSGSLRFTQAAGAAFLAHSDRFVNVLAGDGSFLLSFHWKGRQQAHGLAPDIVSAAGAARRWVEGAGLTSLAAAYPFVRFSGLQLAYERGTAVEFQWAALLDATGQDAYRDLVVLASRNDVLRRLFPHLGHRFVLSADEHSDGILVAVFVHSPGRFVIYDDGGGDRFEFEGDAAQTVAYLAIRMLDR